MKLNSLNPIQRLTSFFRRRLAARLDEGCCPSESVKHAVSGHSSPFDILVVSDEISVEDVFSEALVLDHPTLQGLYGGLRHVGPFPAKICGRIVQASAKRFSRRLARQANPADGEKQRVLLEAWFFPVWREIAMLLPARTLARTLARNDRKKLIVIPLTTRRFSYLNYFKWDIQPDEIEPLVLAAECRKAGLDVVLVAKQEIFRLGVNGSASIELEVSPCSTWIERSEPRGHGLTGSTVIVDDGIRNLDYLMSLVPDATTVKSRLYNRPEPAQINLWGPEHNPPNHRISLQFARALPGNMKLFSASDEFGSLATYFIASMSPATEAAIQYAEKCVRSSDIKEAHICDCNFFESAVMSHAVKGNGGRVHLWPHSINHTFLDQHPADAQLATIRTVTASAAQRAKRCFPSTNVILDSGIMLAHGAEPRPFVESERTTVVIFGGSHAVARTPLVDLKRHEKTWVDLLNRLASRADQFRVIFKPKGHWESSQWLSGLVGAGVAFEETQIHANDMNFSNQIFMSVSLASAALMEGLSRGVPFMIARDVEVEDYMDVDPNVVPIGPADFLLQRLLQLRNAEQFRYLTEQQLQWYRLETGFSRNTRNLEVC